LQGNYRNFEFPLNEGRMIAAPDEAVMGYAVFDLMGVKIGDTVEILVDGQPVQLTIVGRHMENFNLDFVVITSLETYQNQTGIQAQPTSYYLT
jgi:predicted lysophospholipase L1 biosynthesis ABC-type transport system permease subunit